MTRTGVLILLLSLAAAGASFAEQPADPPVQPQPEPEPKPDPPLPPTDPPTEPAAETVPLPPEKPVTPDQPGKESATAPVTEDAALTLTTETPVLAPGERAVFSLYGPETFLRGAVGQCSIIDEFGRQVAGGLVNVQDLPCTEGKPRQLQFPLTDLLGQQYTFSLALTGVDGKAVELHAGFIVPQPHSWDAWINLLSLPPASGNWAPLREAGIWGCAQYRMHPALHESLRKRRVPFYVENVSRQLLSRYHTERGLWERTIAAMSDPKNTAALNRDPSLCAPGFAEALAKEARRHAEFYAEQKPLFYSLGSEPSVTRLAAAADFDFSPEALTEFRRWLERDVYGTVGGLNSAWDTKFETWADVVPMTTDEARLRLNDGVLNLAPWADFREFQDVAFSKVLRGAADVIRQKDPAAKVGITGAMGAFAFGGWDWARLSQALDIVECYDLGSARALWRDLAPGKPALATITLSADGDAEAAAAEGARTLWRLALEGGRRGAILWNDSHGAAGLLDDTGKLTASAQKLAPVLRNLNGAAGALLSRCSREDDGVALLYSPASVRVWWLLEANRLQGDKWLQAWGADTAAERRQSPQLRLRLSWEKLLDDLGLCWRYVSSAQLEQRDFLKQASVKTIVLPRVIALSDREADALKSFVQAGGRLIADAACGRFDEHGKARKKPPLDELFGVETSAEPFFAKPMNPLEPPKAEAAFIEKLGLSKDAVASLPPVFSDEPKLIDKRLGSVADYRGAPVAACGPSTVYLNLDLTDYLRWRLHPDAPLARVTREVLQRATLAERALSPIDWARSRLPEGTQVTWLRCGGARVLALRRNHQERLHELGGEGDGNWAFEKPAEFSLALREPLFVAGVQPFAATPREPVRTIAGTLDPVTPSIFVLNSAKPQGVVVQAPAAAKQGDVIEIKLSTTTKTPCLYALSVTGPDGAERSAYSATRNAPDGELTQRLPLAMNDPPGEWRVCLRELLSGFEQVLKLTVLESAK